MFCIAVNTNENIPDKHAALKRRLIISRRQIRINLLRKTREDQIGHVKNLDLRASVVYMVTTRIIMSDMCPKGPMEWPNVHYVISHQS